jgi:tetratricopeptide (TPR) repeat protein
MDASLLGWFLEHVPTDDTGRCISLVVRRLERPDEDLALRSRYLTFLQRLPEEFREQRREAVDDITRWVSLHDNTPVVWAQYLAFLQGLPEEFDEQRKQAVADTPSWLERHGDAAILWMQFLAFLQSLPEEFDGHRRQAAIDIASWIARDDVEAGVVARNLTFVQSLPVECLEERKQAVAHTRTWLALHEDAPVVWVHYLTLLRGRPEEFDKQREQAAGDTEKWLERNDDAPAVWIEYLALVQGLSEEFREQRKRAVVATVGWLSRHDDEAGVWCQYLTFVQQLPAGFDDERIEAARAASDWLDRHPGSQEVRARYVLFILGVTDPALEPFQSASDIHHQWLIATNPGALNHRFNYGEQLRRLSRFDEAIAQYDIVLRQHKGHQMARRARGLSLQMLGRMPEAEAEFKHALWWARHGKHSQAIFHTTLGDFYLRSQRWQEAIRSFQRAQQEFPDHFANHRGIAKAHLELGNLGEAENAVKRALADPNLDLAARREIVQLYDALRLGQIP